MERKKMKRVNVIIESDVYERARAVAFLRKESISEIFREAMREWMSTHLDKRVELLLSASDERKLLKILESDEFASAGKANKLLRSRRKGASPEDSKVGLNRTSRKLSSITGDSKAYVDAIRGEWNRRK
jgi:hypothetical protein